MTYYGENRVYFNDSDSPFIDDGLEACKIVRILCAWHINADRCCWGLRHACVMVTVSVFILPRHSFFGHRFVIQGQAECRCLLFSLLFAGLKIVLLFIYLFLNTVRAKRWNRFLRRTNMSLLCDVKPLNEMFLLSYTMVVVLYNFIATASC